MKLTLAALIALTAASPTAVDRRQSNGSTADLLTDIKVIQQYWGQVTPYSDNNETYFGVTDTGLPNSCQIEQVHLLERHGSRFPTGSYDDGENDSNLATKLRNLTATNATAKFTGPLSFLNGYQYNLGSGLLVGRGAVCVSRLRGEDVVKV